MRSSRGYLLIVACIFAFITATSSKSKHKPASNYFKICRRGDPNQLSECVKSSLEQLRPTMSKGIPELGLIPLDPLVIPRLEWNEGSGSFAFKTTLTNFTFSGLRNVEVKSGSVFLDDKTFKIDLDLLTHQVNSTANYEMEGQILVIPISGKGHCEMNFTDLSTVVHTTGKLVTRGGEQYIQLTNIKWTLAVNHEKSRSWFYNLFNGNKQLGDATNTFLRQNAAEAFQAIKHLPEEAFGELFRDLASRVFDMYPVSKLFPK